MRNADMPAYPHLLKAGEVAKSEGGLTKREYFAAMAMQGLLASEAGGDHFDTEEGAAMCAVSHADALLDALEGP